MTLDQQLAIWIAAHAIKKPDMLLTPCIIGFVKKMGLDHNDTRWIAGTGLVPEKFSPAWKGTVRRFVCGYIIGGSDAMYKDGQTPIGLGVWLTGKKAQQKPIDLGRTKDVRLELARATKAFKRASTMKKLANEVWESNLTSNWNVCK